MLHANDSKAEMVTDREEGTDTDSDQTVTSKYRFMDKSHTVLRKRKYHEGDATYDSIEEGRWLRG